MQHASISGPYLVTAKSLQGEASFPSSTTQRYPSQFLIKMLRGEHLVAVSDIDWIASARNYLLLHCGGREYPMRCTMRAMEQQLDPARFARVHRSAIVNLEQVQELEQELEGLGKELEPRQVPLMLLPEQTPQL